ncbi:hypothetical protein [Xenorhabdus szentirmaii]|uniref:hypothetical protein n=1 Tax=Xenorhabdus szentirmaii TaxID=290112 RepID=UPI001989B318|nr:hypothetical protein [Xenorhabdus sp. 38]MBD2782660.1 hypothetical protein [Xenorhabdus sp. 38]
MSDRSLANIYAHPADVMEPLAAFLKAVEFLRLDPEARDIEADLLAYAQQLLQLHTNEAKSDHGNAESQVTQPNEVLYAW